MCKHILNAQVSIRAPCCKKWFDCPDCHAEIQDHPLKKSTEMVMACKKCKKCFRKDLTNFDEEVDKYCPHCDNCYVLDAITAKDAGKLVVTTETRGGEMIRKEINIQELFEKDAEFQALLNGDDEDIDLDS